MKSTRVSSGICGVDQILHGGFLSSKAYLLRGGAGTGKSTAGYHFLEEGVRQGETSLLITLGEPKENIFRNTANMNIDLSEVVILDMSPEDTLYTEDQSYSVFLSSEVETEPMVEKIVEAISEYSPDRVMLDSLTMLRYLYQDPFQYRNRVLSFIRYICSGGATLVMVSESHVETNEDEAEFWVDGVLNFINSSNWRRFSVKKFRGSDFQSGNHALKMTENGIKVYPRLRPNRFERTFKSDPLPFGITELDSMLHGGIERGTITMISGPTGVGKTNLGIQFMKQAASRNDRSVIYTFEESVDVIVKRSKLISVPVDEMILNGKLEIKYIQPFAYSPDEFSDLVQQDIEKNNTKNILIDSVRAYGLSVREGDSLERLHSLCVYMGNMGVTGFLISETSNITGQFVNENLHASYLSDNIIFLRYLELDGELRKAVGVLKKRLSDFEKSIREFNITSGGIKVGNPLTHLRGILTGVPESLK
ncbi:MAG: hypothetical protein JJU13_11400 [Balneolaceae bacterium]|nr:hypothetical protein [Balneolaceae bacterium]